MAAGSGLLGKIGVELYADMARFTGDLGKAEKQTRDWVGNVTGQFTKVQGAIAGIGATLGVIGFAAKINEVAKFRAGLDDLADAGLGTVESLSRVKNSIRAFGGDFDDVAMRLGKMVNGLAGSDKETSKAGDALERLGIKARTAAGALRAPSEVFEELSVSLAKYRDNADKTAVVQAILGKGAEKYLPLLKDMAELGIKAATVTAQQAQEADNYEKAIRRLGMAFDGSGKIIAGEFIVPVTAAAQVLADLITKSNGFRDSVKSLAGDGSIGTWIEEFGSGLYEIGRVVTVLGGNVKFVFTAIGREIGGIAAQLVALAAGDWNAFTAIGDDMKASAAQARKDFDEWEKRVMNSSAFKTQLSVNKALAGAYDDQVSRRFGVADKPTLDSSGLGTLDKKAKEVSEYAKAIEDANKRVATSYAETLDPLNSLTSAEKKLIELRSSDVWKNFKDEQGLTATQQRINLRLTLEQAAANERAALNQKDWLRAVQEYNKAADEQAQKQQDAIRGIDEKTDGINEELANYGKLPSAINAATVALNEQVLAQARMNDAAPETIDYLEKLIASQKKYGAALANKESFQTFEAGMARLGEVVNSIGDAIGNFAVAFTKGWKSGTDYARNLLKQLWADLAAFAAKKWVLNFVAGAGLVGLSTAASAASSAMGTSAMGTGLSAAGNWLAGTSAVTSMFGTAAIADSAALYAATAMPMAEMAVTATAGSIGAGGITASITSALAAIPVWGWIAIAALGAYAAFGGKGGGPKSGGSFQSNGDLTNLFGLKDNEATGNSAVKSLVDASKKQYTDLLKMLGGTSKGFQFGLAYDTDPQGTAQNRITSYLKDAGGNSLYGFRDKEIGRDEKDIAPALSLEASRQTLVALQNSDFPAYLTKLFNSLSASTATEEQINGLIKSGVELKNFFDTAQAVAKGIFNPETSGLESAQKLVNDYFESIGEAVPKSVEAFKAWVDSIDLTTESGQNALLTLGKVPDAFKMIQDAAAAMVSRMGSLLTSIYGGTYGRQIAQSAFDAAANQWNTYLTSQGIGTPGYTAGQTFTDLLTNPGLAGGVYEMVQNGTLSTEAGNIFNDLLAAFQTLQAASQTTTGAVVDFGSAASSYATDLANARSGLADYLNNSLLSNLSPLNPMQRYNEARAQYETQFSLAQDGDIDALSSIGGYRDAFLEASRLVNASNGQYNNDFFGSFNELAGLTSGAVRPYSAADGLENTQALIAEQAITTQAIAALANVVIEIAQTGDPILRAKAQEQVDVLNKIASNGGSLVSTGF